MSLTPKEITTIHEDAVIQEALHILDMRLHRPKNLLNEPNLVHNYLKVMLGQLEHEVFGMLILNVNFGMVENVLLFTGTLSHCSVYPREVVKNALAKNAHAVILYHNHPSGSCEPSSADHSLTSSLKTALDLVDVKVVDHIVVGGGSYFSFSENGNL